MGKDIENQWSHQGVTTATTNIKGFATVKKENEGMKGFWGIWGEGKFTLKDGKGRGIFCNPCLKINCK